MANFTGVNGTTGGRISSQRSEDGDPILDFDGLVEQVRLLRLNKVEHEKYELATFEIRERLDKLEEDTSLDDAQTPGPSDAPKKSKKDKAAELKERIEYLEKQLDILLKESQANASMKVSIQELQKKTQFLVTQDDINRLLASIKQLEDEMKMNGLEFKNLHLQMEEFQKVKR